MTPDRWRVIETTAAYRGRVKVFFTDVYTSTLDFN